MVELSTAFNIALSLVAFFGGWFMKVLFERIKRLEDADEKMTEGFSAMRDQTMSAMTEIRVELPTNYISKTDFKALGDNIFNAIRSLGTDTRESLKRIEEKLDMKVDKS